MEKRWRGRPRKVIEVSEEQVVKKRGRPRKVIVEKTFEEQIIVKKRWRPRKEKTLDVKEEDIKQVALQKKDKFGKVEKTWKENDIFYNTKIVNMTPHDVVFENGMRVAASGEQIRINIDANELWNVSGVPVYGVNYSIWSIPWYQPNRIYIVSNWVAMAHKNRCDLYVPYKINHIKGRALGICKNPFYKELEEKDITRTELFIRINELTRKNEELEKLYKDLAKFNEDRDSELATKRLERETVIDECTNNAIDWINQMTASLRGM